MARRRNDAPWRAEVIAKRGSYCRRCKRSNDLQADHLMPRSQGGPSVVENGLILCRDCHRLKTEHAILIDSEWLDEDQIDWLYTAQWVWWDRDGETWGRGRRSFRTNIGRKQSD